ncbi:cytochrome P450 [Ganoderma leucocontextum]|nr:cytochrome P450 [Ganoderma leucocontextum]
MDLVRLATTLLTPSALLGLSFCALVLAYLRSHAAWNARSRRLPLPPGPKPLSLVGNMFDWPKSNQWVVLRDMSVKYGDVLHFDVFGRHMIVLGSASAILELLDKRSANTSSRERNALTTLAAQEYNFSGMPYGQWWRRHKRAFWQEFHPGAVLSYQPTQRRAAHRFLKKLLTSPSKLREHVRFTFSSAILEVLFGVDVAHDGDELIDIVEAALEWHGEAFVPGKYLVEALPILQYIPPWVPGATVQRLSVHWKSTISRLREEPYRHVKTGNGGDCAVSRMIARMVGSGEKPSAREAEEIIRNVAVVAIDGALLRNATPVVHCSPHFNSCRGFGHGGYSNCWITILQTDVSQMFSTVQSIFVAMSLYPDVQKRAQAELDDVVGPNRLPDFEDSGRLVYVNALIKEALRWQNVLPFAIPHKTVEDDEFRGYFIPAGNEHFPERVPHNGRACMHDPDVYEDPDVFRPERFIRDGRLDFSTAPDPAKFIFGFGRRMCPGRYFAENGLFINVASALHVFDITPPVDENGRVIKIEPQVTEGLLCYPVDCRCTIKPRSAQAEALINEAQSFH